MTALKIILILLTMALGFAGMLCSMASSMVSQREEQRERGKMDA